MNDVDLLMSRIAEINAKSPLDLTPADITSLIAYYRNQRARRAAGEKLAKPALEKAKPTKSLTELLSLTVSGPGPLPGPLPPHAKSRR